MSKVTEERQENKKELHKIKIMTPDTGYEPFPVSIINRSTREALSFDPSLGNPANISYKLTKAGTVRLRIVRRDNPELLLLTLQDWKEQAFGEHTVQWDGRDASGNIIDNKWVIIQFDAKDQAFGGNHQGHETSACFDPELTITNWSDPARDGKGNLTFITSLAREADKWKPESGCEVNYFIDYVLFKKEKYQNNEDTFYLTLDTTGLSDGHHFITVNVDDLNDHIGTASLIFEVRN
jgi:hypothetical protein